MTLTLQRGLRDEVGSLVYLEVLELPRVRSGYWALEGSRDVLRRNRPDHNPLLHSDEASVKLYRVKRSRACTCCMRPRYRVQLPAPKPDDPDYKVAVCPDCDKTVGRVAG